MGGISIWHWVIVLLLLVGWIWPLAVILRKAGFSGWWAALATLPVAGMFVLWGLAIAQWPSREDEA